MKKLGTIFVLLFSAVAIALTVFVFGIVARDAFADVRCGEALLTSMKRLLLVSLVLLGIAYGGYWFSKKNDQYVKLSRSVFFLSLALFAIGLFVDGAIWYAKI